MARTKKDIHFICGNQDKALMENFIYISKALREKYKFNFNGLAMKWTPKSIKR